MIYPVIIMVYMVLHNYLIKILQVIILNLLIAT